MGEADCEKSGHELLFADTMEPCAIENHERCDHRFVLNPLVEPKKREVAETMNQDVLQPEIGLRRRNKMSK